MSTHSALATPRSAHISDTPTAAVIAPATRYPRTHGYASTAAITISIVLGAAALATVIAALLGASVHTDRPVTPRPSSAAAPQP